MSVRSGAFAWLCAEPARGGLTAPLVIIGLWFALTLTVLSRHEFWRDEVRAYSLALSAESLFDLPRVLKNDGHPCLWHALLRGTYRIVGSSAALPVASMAVALAAVALFVLKAPFPLWFRALFPFGGLPAYEYSVMARNYGISMLLLFAFAALYPRRDRSPWLLATTLALLANTNALAMIFSVLLAGLWAWDSIASRQEPRSAATVGRLIGCTALIVLGVLLSVFTCWPDARSTFGARSLHPRPGDLVESAVLNLVVPGLHLRMLSFWKPCVDIAFAWLLVAGLAIRPRLALLVLAASSCFGVFTENVYGLDYRHQGVLVCLVLTCYWIARDGEAFGLGASAGSPRARLHRLVLTWIAPVLLIVQVGATARLAIQDWWAPRSSCKALAALLSQRADLASAVIVAEPAVYLEALPYYCDVPIYLPREGRFGRTVRFTTEAKSELTLSELLADARRLRQEGRRSVYVVLGQARASRRPWEPATQPGRPSFSWTEAARSDFTASTSELASFDRAVTGENFRVYRLLR